MSPQKPAPIVIYWGGQRYEYASMEAAKAAGFDLSAPPPSIAPTLAPPAKPQS